MTPHTPLVERDDDYAALLERWLETRPPRSRRPVPPALVVAYCVLATVLLAAVFVLPSLLRSVGAALQ